MQFQILKNSNIDKAKWDDTIKKSSNGLIYAWSVYLDHMCPGWKAIANEDYSIVMPLTIRKKWGINYLFQPAFTQQLGIFSNQIITLNNIQEIINTTKKAAYFAEININYENSIIYTENIIYKKNYILYLNDNIEKISSFYSENLTRNIHNSEKHKLQFLKSNDIDKSIKTYQQLYGSFLSNIKKFEYNSFTNLCKELANTNDILIREIRSPQNHLLAINLFLKDNNRIYNIAPSTLPQGRSLNAQHFLIHSLIKEFANTNYILDFEGSDIPGIEAFYKKFGATNQPYGFLKWNNLPPILKLIKK